METRTGGKFRWGYALIIFVAMVMVIIGAIEIELSLPSRIKTEQEMEILTTAWLDAIIDAACQRAQDLSGDPQKTWRVLKVNPGPYSILISFDGDDFFVDNTHRLFEAWGKLGPGQTFRLEYVGLANGSPDDPANPASYLAPVTSVPE